MEFKIAYKGDATILAELRKQQLIDEGQTPNINIDHELKNYFLSILSNNSSTVWIATDNNIAIATGSVCFFQHPPSYSNPTGKIAYIHSVYTATEYRRQGISSRILTKIMKEVEKRNCKVIQLKASDDGKFVYEKLGFTAYDGYMILKI